MNKNCFAIGKDQPIKPYGITFFNKNMPPPKNTNEGRGLSQTPQHRASVWSGIRQKGVFEPTLYWRTKGGEMKGEVETIKWKRKKK